MSPKGRTLDEEATPTNFVTSATLHADRRMDSLARHPFQFFTASSVRFLPAPVIKNSTTLGDGNQVNKRKKIEDASLVCSRSNLDG